MVEKSGWTGLGLVAARSDYPTARKREEWSRPGVYLLSGPPQGTGARDRLYIGEADDVRLRMIDHVKKKDFWTGVVAFTSKDNSLNKAHVRYMEARLLLLAKEADRVDLDNTTAPAVPPMSEADRADAEGFLDEMLPILPLLGIRAFEKVEQAGSGVEQFFLTGPDAQATGADTADGFIVFEKSLARATTVPSIHAYLAALRQTLIADGVLLPAGSHLRFAKPWVFDSPSTAAGVVLGRAANGRTEWKDASGTTLKQRQDAAVEL